MPAPLLNLAPRFIYAAGVIRRYQALSYFQALRVRDFETGHRHKFVRLRLCITVFVVSEGTQFMKLFGCFASKVLHSNDTAAINHPIHISTTTHDKESL